MLLCVCVCVGGALTLKKACTRSRDTECGCKAGLRCGDGHCSFCVQECGKGQEPLPAARKTHLYLQTRKSYKLSGMPNKTHNLRTLIHQVSNLCLFVFIGSCRNCPVGTFSDQIHEKCKPWRTRLDLISP